LDHSTSPTQPQIFFYDPLGAQFQGVGYAASGSGSVSIRSILSYQERHGEPRPSQMDLRTAVRFALRLLMTAAEFDSATGGVNPDTQDFATIKVLRSDGVRTVSVQEQAEYSKA
ncbi:MAG: proteasome subunit alpha, partial [Pedosphaera parvula]|nr:proteasome subunit alpha [Pedosphaera parvula]